MALTSDELHRKAAHFRKNPTQTEHIAITVLTAKMPPKSFEFQKVLGFFILDFFIPEKCLAVEIDGWDHQKKEYYDSLRDRFINECGIKVLRIPSDRAKEIFDLVSAYPSFINHEQHNRKAFAIGKDRKAAFDSNASSRTTGIQKKGRHISAKGMNRK